MTTVYLLFVWFFCHCSEVTALFLCVNVCVCVCVFGVNTNVLFTVMVTRSSCTDISFFYFVFLTNAVLIVWCVRTSLGEKVTLDLQQFCLVKLWHVLGLCWFFCSRQKRVWKTKIRSSFFSPCLWRNSWTITKSGHKLFCDVAWTSSRAWWRRLQDCLDLEQMVVRRATSRISIFLLHAKPQHPRRLQPH